MPLLERLAAARRSYAVAMDAAMRLPLAADRAAAVRRVHIEFRAAVAA